MSTCGKGMVQGLTNFLGARKMSVGFPHGTVGLPAMSILAIGSIRVVGKVPRGKLPTQVRGYRPMKCPLHHLDDWASSTSLLSATQPISPHFGEQI